ncbi:MAG: hypothetical protein QXH24_07460 [Candidatus Bathyarchaeia archaeon]
MEKKFFLIVIPLILILFLSLFLILQKPSFTIHEEVAPITITRTIGVTSTTIVRYQTQVQRSQVLFRGENLLIPVWGYRYSGPYHIDAGRILKVYWEADTSVNVYILNDVDWANRFFGAPTRYRTTKTGGSGVLEYHISHSEPLYVQVLCPTWCSAKLYVWEERVEWIENVEAVRTNTFVVPKEEIEVISTTRSIQIPSYSTQQYGFVLAILSGVILAIVVPIIITKSREQHQKEIFYEEYDFSEYQSLLQELEKLEALKERLKTFYESGKIGQETYTKLDNELSTKITEIKDRLFNQRSFYEKELTEIEERIKELKGKVEELKTRRDLDMIDEDAFNKSIQQIESELRKILQKKRNIMNILSFLSYGNNDSYGKR